ncbi:MAG: YfiR family protein [Thiotrichales bacterium]
MRREIRSPKRWLLALLSIALLSSIGARADTLSEDDVKAGFIFNFTKYLEWPDTQADSALVVCSTGVQPLSGKLESLQGRVAQGRTIRVRTQVRSNEWRECQVLFIDAEEAPRMDTLLRVVAQFPVLTVSDAPEFVQAGGIIGLKLRAGRIRFDINQASAREAGLKLSSQLLKLAEEVVQ